MQNELNKIEKGAKEGIDYIKEGAKEGVKKIKDSMDDKKP